MELRSERTLLVDPGMQKTAKTKPAKATNLSTAAKPLTTPAPAATVPSLGLAVTLSPAEPEAKLSERVTFWSQVEPTYSVRVLRSLADKYEAPSHGGKPMVLRAGRSAGISAKQTREQLLASMSEEQRVTFLADEKQARKLKRAERKAEERTKLEAQIRAQLEAEQAGK